MEEQLREELDVEVGLIAGGGGVFEVSVNGRKIFSKKQLNRFPHEGEILSLLKN